MPKNLKLMLSVILVVVGAIIGYWQARIGQSVNQWLAPLLGLFMVFAIWLFPEAGNKKGGTRSEAPPREGAED